MDGYKAGKRGGLGESEGVRQKETKDFETLTFNHFLRFMVQITFLISSLMQAILQFHHKRVKYARQNHNGGFCFRGTKIKGICLYSYTG